MEPNPHAPRTDPRPFLEQRVLGRAAKRVAFDYDVFFAEKRYERFERLAIGTMTVTDMVSRTRYIDHSLWPYTEWELAREYLRWIFETQRTQRQKRVGWNLQTWKLLSIHQPLYFEKPVRGELAYLDISSAYWQLYSSLTLDVYFNPWKRGFGLGGIRFLAPEWLRAQRTVRNALIGISRSKEHHEYAPNARPGKGVRPIAPGSPWVIRRTYNQFLAPELWGYIAFMLHHVADFLMQNYDVYYVHTDGYILPAKQAKEATEAVYDRWRLALSTKALGDGEVTGMGRWKIGGQGTKNYGDGQPVRYIMDANPELSDWLASSRRWSLGASAHDPVFD